MEASKLTFHISYDEDYKEFTFLLDSIRKMDDQEVPEIVCPSAGVHIILPNYYSPEKMGLIDPETSDGRVIFLLPWQNSTIAGTTDSPCEVKILLFSKILLYECNHIKSKDQTPPNRSRIALFR